MKRRHHPLPLPGSLRIPLPDVHAVFVSVAEPCIGRLEGDLFYNVALRLKDGTRKTLVGQSLNLDGAQSLRSMLDEAIFNGGAQRVKEIAFSPLS